MNSDIISVNNNKEFIIYMLSIMCAVLLSMTSLKKLNELIVDEIDCNMSESIARFEIGGI